MLVIASISELHKQCMCAHEPTALKQHVTVVHWIDRLKKEREKTKPLLTTPFTILNYIHNFLLQYVIGVYDFKW